MIDQPVQLGNIFVVVIWMNERMATIMMKEALWRWRWVVVDQQ